MTKPVASSLARNNSACQAGKPFFSPSQSRRLQVEGRQNNRSCRSRNNTQARGFGGVSHEQTRSKEGNL